MPIYDELVLCIRIKKNHLAIQNFKLFGKILKHLNLNILYKLNYSHKQLQIYIYDETLV